METYIIIIETSETSISQLLNNLRNIGEPMLLVNNVIILRTSLKATDIRDYVTNSISADKIFVTAISTPAAWKGIQPDMQLIKKLYNVQD